MSSCSNGHINPDGAKFCQVCGAEVINLSERTCKHSMPITGENACGICTPEELHQAATSTGGNSTFSNSTNDVVAKLQHILKIALEYVTLFVNTVVRKFPKNKTELNDLIALAKQSNKKQRIVAIGAVGGLAFLLIFFNFIYMSVPNLVGLNSTRAYNVLVEEGFKNGDVKSVYSDTVPTGQVMKVTSSSRALRGSKIDYVLSKGPETTLLTMNLTVYGTTYYFFDGGNCITGLLGYTDIYWGATATVTGSPSFSTSGALSSSAGYTGVTCKYTATFTVPKNLTSYTLNVGHRSPVSYTKSELEAQGWTLDLTLGN